MKRRRTIQREDRYKGSIPVVATKNESRQRHTKANKLNTLLCRAMSSPTLPSEMTYSPRNQASFVVAFLSTILYLVLLIAGAREVWTYPVVIGGMICWILLEDEPNSLTTKRRSPVISRLYQCLTCSQRQSRATMFHKDIHHRLVKTTWIFIVVPCVTFFAIRAIKHIGSAHKKKANDFGFLAVVAMSYFLIPVSRQSVIVEALGIGSAHATRLHVWAGVLALFGGLTHGLYYCWLWFLHENKSLEEIVPFPSDTCWTWDYGSSCHKKFVNLLGFLCGTAFLILGATSLWVVRRRFFRVFYFCHIGSSFILMFALVMHYNKMILYLAPSLIYYLASNVPQCVEWISKWINGGNAIASFIEIPDSGGCVELSLRMPDQTSSSLCGRYIRLAVPSISAISHPFSSFVHVGYPGELKVIFRSHGPFTKTLSKKLSNASSVDSISYPSVVVNGVRSGTNQWKHAIQQDTLVIFAGGVGIVTYISLLSFMASLSKSHDELENAEETCRAIHKRRNVCVHWACRDEGLIDYVEEKYIDPLQEFFRARTSNIEIKLVIHHTSIAPREAMVGQKGKFGASESDFAKSQLPVASSFESGDSIPRNFTAGIPFGLIGMGGIAIIAYCYENIQEKHVAETRMIAIVAAILWSIAVATVVFVANRLSTCVPSKGLYSKLNKNAEIECTELGKSQSDKNSRPEIAGLDRSDELADSEESGEKSWMTVLHKEERPDLKVAIQEAAEDSIDGIQNLSVGVFVCGPTSLIDAVRTTANSLNEGRNSDSKIAVDVYDEIFEL
ncbi:unnamed protein product [Cylindrotheca closterium]|uniref:FAD-binding FR-type domain-containing protein n=1 Tax=Cylindrotheca closterium TaxID=2856 RepID=A0AAD2JHL4_9STRA|nr:unnamed protein product [Cylindrotheca closterium]